MNEQNKLQLAHELLKDIVTYRDDENLVIRPRIGMINSSDIERVVDVCRTLSLNYIIEAEHNKPVIIIYI